MISDMASLLAELRAAEERDIAAQGITHAPTIGAMYEGLTRDLLSRTIPPSADLRVVHGFVEGIDGTLSTQIDCMLVTGSGRALPHTDASVWGIADVLAIPEIKKNLFGRELDESIAKQSAIYRMFTRYMEHGSSERRIDLSPTFRAFSQITGKHLANYAEADCLPDLEKIIFHLMVIELIAPIRIILGYEGYASEHSLRSGLAKFLESELQAGPMPGRGAFSLPNLIVARSNSLVKLNGYPYLAPLDNDAWHVIVSNSENPLRIMIELIWSKLENRLGIKLPDDSNLQKERMAPLLKGRVQAIDVGQWGWRYELVDLSDETLVELKAEKWAPQTLEREEWALLILAMKRGFLDLDDEELRRSDSEGETNTGTAADQLVKKRLLARHGDRILRPIHDNVITMVTPDGKLQISVNMNMAGEWLAEEHIWKLKPRKDA